MAASSHIVSPGPGSEPGTASVRQTQMKCFRLLLLGLAAFAAFTALTFWFFTREETETRLWCTDGRVCTEYFSLKDGLPVRTVCPAEGNETYDLPERCIRSGDDCSCEQVQERSR